MVVWQKELFMALTAAVNQTLDWLFLISLPIWQINRNCFPATILPEHEWKKILCWIWIHLYVWWSWSGLPIQQKWCKYFEEWEFIYWWKGSYLFDFLTRDGFTLLDGSGTLNVSIKSESPISRVRYVNNNSILTDNEQNRVFKKFIDFVERMLCFIR